MDKKNRTRNDFRQWLTGQTDVCSCSVIALLEFWPVKISAQTDHPLFVWPLLLLKTEHPSYVVSRRTTGEHTLSTKGFFSLTMRSFVGFFARVTLKGFTETGNRTWKASGTQRVRRTLLQNTDLIQNVQAKLKWNVNLVLCHIFSRFRAVKSVILRDDYLTEVLWLYARQAGNDLTSHADIFSSAWEARNGLNATAVASMRRTEALASVKFYQILSIFIFFIRLIILEDFIRLISYNGPCVRLGCSFFLASALNARQ